MAIGWQFLYEGLWKLNTLSTAKPWSSAGYLRRPRADAQRLPEDDRRSG